MKPGVAAGHPQTLDAGLEILADGGSAADAAVAASLASCVSETLMTGFLGGGHAIYFDAASGTARNLDCFVATPGLGGEPRHGELVELSVPFGAELVTYAVGPASCGVPGLPAGLDELWRAHGRLPWERVVAPALALAYEGTSLPPQHAACLAMLAPVMTMNEGARIYTPAGELLGPDSVVRQQWIAVAFEAIAAEGARTAYEGTIAEALLALLGERGGLVTRADLDAYRPEWREPQEVAFAGTRFLTRAGLSGVPETLRALAAPGPIEPPARALALLDALRWAAPGPESHTTNIVTLDADGNACALTSSLGLGSGDFLPGLDLHLNSMLGEVDLLRGPLDPGERVGSMMAPSLAFDRAGLALALGSAGGTRLRTALVGVAAAILDEGIEPQAAVDRPRFHPAGETLNVEPGLDEAVLEALGSRGLALRVWPGLHHYFGGVSAIGRSGGAGDPRRNGAARAPG